MYGRRLLSRRLNRYFGFSIEEEEEGKGKALILFVFCIADEKQVWDLPTNLTQEVSSVEELLRRGGCDSANSRLVLQVHCRFL